MATIKISDVKVSPTDSFFFDTNVWMFLFAPLANAKPYKQKQYSCLLRDIRTRNACVWISSLVISEYVNAVLRLEFKQWMRKNHFINADFKHDFRPTIEYKNALSDIKLQVSDILSVATRRPDDFHNTDIDSLINVMGDQLDFADALIVKSCFQAGLKLVTDDKDITESVLSISVITA